LPYGPANQDGVCHDADDEREGRPRPTGSMPGCRTPTGIYDLSGNVAEWTGADEGSAALSGSYFSKEIQHSCREKRSTFGPGYRNHTTGFRCCADHPVEAGAAAAVAPEETALEPGRPAPPFAVAGADGKPLDESALRGHVTVVSFFASWCAPCRRELPELAELYRALGPQGLQVIAIGVDTDEAHGRSFAAGLGLPFTVAFDPKSVALGRFGVKSMPTSFLVGPDGVVRDRVVGANPKKLQVLAEHIRAALAAP
jgi:peroxiredoxin